MEVRRILLVQPLGAVSEGFAAPGSAVQPDSGQVGWTGHIGTGTTVINRIARGIGFRAPFAPITLATVAALTPAHIEVELWNEYTQGPVEQGVDPRRFDLVAMTGFHLHRPRAMKLAEFFRGLGLPVVVGGPGVSSEPDAYRDSFDHLFIGEAEYTWPQFFQDLRTGTARKEYRQIQKPELDDVPQPRWDLVPTLANDYLMGLVQTTRGCPFDCEFCDVIHLFGRRSRHRPVDVVLEEVRNLERRGVRQIFFSDDNFIGRPSYAKELLEKLIPLNNSFHVPLMFSTQLTMNVARDDTLLEMLADANFFKVLIGIESANPESLVEANKPQNYKTDLIADIHKIHSYGIAIHGQFIVGFDNDGPDIFETTFRFIQESCIPTVILNVLYALPGTMLWHRMHREGRVLATEMPEELGYRSNIQFKSMSRREVYEGFLRLYRRVYEPENLRARMQGMIDQISRRPRVKRPSMLTMLTNRGAGLPSLFTVRRMLTRDPAVAPIIRRTMARAAWRAPFALPKIAGLWINSLMLRDFTEMLPAGIQAVLDHESVVPPRPLPQRAVVLTPESRRLLKDMFASVYQRLGARLVERRQIIDAAAEVFTAFVERFHAELDRLGEGLFVQMQEICDRTIARLNGETPLLSADASAPPIRSAADIVDPEGRRCVDEIRRLRLAEDVINAVELELRRVAASGGCGSDHHHDDMVHVVSLTGTGGSPAA